MADSERKGIAWDADATTPNGITSLDVLLSWIGDPVNYERWRGGKPPGTAATRSLKAAETKEKVCGEIVGLLHAVEVERGCGWACSKRQVPSDLHPLSVVDEIVQQYDMAACGPKRRPRG